MAVISAVVFCIAKKTGSVSDVGMTAVSILPALIVIQAVMIPFQLKFGGEKGRIALIGTLGLLFVVGMVIGKAAQILGIDIADMIDNFPVVSMGVMVTALVAAAAILLLVSMKISITIMKTRNFRGIDCCLFYLPYPPLLTPFCNNLL